MSRHVSVGQLGDRLAIRELTARYNRAVDDGDGEAFASTFTSDGRLEVGTEMVCIGFVELAAFGGKPRGTVHVTSDAIVELDGEDATQRCTLVLFRRSRDGHSVSVENTGRYDDRLVRTGDGWRFRSRTVTLDVVATSHRCRHWHQDEERPSRVSDRPGS
jgi:hypothetical protein